MAFDRDAIGMAGATDIHTTDRNISSEQKKLAVATAKM